jgi:hypothetical protein
VGFDDAHKGPRDLDANYNKIGPAHAYQVQKQGALMARAPDLIADNALATGQNGTFAGIT